MEMRLRAAMIIAAAALGLSACGATHVHPGGNSASTLVPPAPHSLSARRQVVALGLELELPLVGLSSATAVSYATTAGRPTLRGVVRPAGTTVYVRKPDGTRTAVNPRADGAFSVLAKLEPGPNSFEFTAARLGAHSVVARLAVTWRGRGAAARLRAMAADPARYMAPASAGLNHRLTPVGDLAPIPGRARRITVTFSLNTIKAPAPPAAGGDGRWLGGFELTEYYPALEAWFVGRPVPTPGLPGPHRIDWLYSAHGMSMEGDGIGLDGKPYHIANLGSGGWLTSGGAGGAQFGIGSDAPFWRTGGFWRSASGTLTFPLASGGWSAGIGVRYVDPPPGITFAPGPSRPLSYLRSVAVDPRLIPLGSHIFIPAYAAVNGGWFEADDTGGAIIGRHIDVFRPPPSNPNDQGNFATGQPVYIVAPGKPLP
jgi:3D (Asp-Asp-Asp) domain-containing protein